MKYFYAALLFTIVVIPYTLQAMEPTEPELTFTQDDWENGISPQTKDFLRELASRATELANKEEQKICIQSAASNDQELATSIEPLLPHNRSTLLGGYRSNLIFSCIAGVTSAACCGIALITHQEKLQHAALIGFIGCAIISAWQAVKGILKYHQAHTTAYTACYIEKERALTATLQAFGQRKTADFTARLHAETVAAYAAGQAELCSIKWELAACTRHTYEQAQEKLRLTKQKLEETQDRHKIYISGRREQPETIQEPPTVYTTYKGLPISAYAQAPSFSRILGLDENPKAQQHFIALAQSAHKGYTKHVAKHGSNTNSIILT